MSRSWRRISFSRRSRLSSAAASSPATRRFGSSISRSRTRDSQRVNVDWLTPRSSPISRFVRPLVCSRRTASSSNAFVNRFRSISRNLLPTHQELSTFPKQVQHHPSATLAPPPTCRLTFNPDEPDPPFATNRHSLKAFDDGQMLSVPAGIGRAGRRQQEICGQIAAESACLSPRRQPPSGQARRGRHPGTATVAYATGSTIGSNFDGRIGWPSGKGMLSSTQFVL